MNTFKCLSLGLGIVGLVTGVYAAYLWNIASKIPVTPTHLQFGGIEPLDQAMSNAQWIVGLLQSIKQSGIFNQRAAKWTAATVLFGSAASFLGLLS
ncbi:hypothetical protein KW842_26690 [Duganella sp. sic0402]|uniref:hypothetical protein n=1 Tax=Duganella sp. sic0402 TaxID=2854786 RepID=UPI001C441A4E|nr:hypothetical protein [Duganella sp. sic0402]MBV7539365.1 hypothetical protein [Duganella sp. sic0402]